MPARAAGAQQTDIVTQADGKSGTVTFSVPSGSSYTLGGSDKDGSGDLSKNDYDKLDKEGLVSGGESSIKNLNLNGGGELQVNAKTTPLSKELTNLAIDNGKFSYITPDFGSINTNNPIFLKKPYSDVDLNVGKNGTLYISGSGSYYGSVFNAFKSIHGSGNITLNNAFIIEDDGKGEKKTGSELTIYGPGSIFSGSIKGEGSVGEGVFGYNGSVLNISAPSFSLDKAHVSNLENIKISSPGYGRYIQLDKDQATMGNAFFHDGTSVESSILTVAASRDGIINTDGRPNLKYRAGFNTATLVAKDQDTSIQTGKLILGWQDGLSSYEQSALDVGTGPQQARLTYGAAHGTLWLADGATATVTNGVYLGNSAAQWGEAEDQDDISPEGEGHGTIHVTGDQVGYDASGKFVNSGTQGQAARLTVQNGGLWIGPVDGGKGSGDIIVEHGGHLALENSFTVLGGQNGAGNIAINQGGSLDVTGMSPAGVSAQNTGKTFNTQRQGAVTIGNGGELNIGNATTAGLLKLYGDLDLQKGSTTTFYEGTTTARGNKGDANNSHAEVTGNVAIGGDIRVAGITGQNKGSNGAVDAGLYHLIDYDGTLSGVADKAAFMATAAGQRGSYFFDGKSLDVMVASATAQDHDSNHDKAAPSAWTGGSGTWSAGGISGQGGGAAPAPAVLNGQGGTIAVSNNGQPLAVSPAGVQFNSNGYTITGGPITGAASNNGQNLLSVATADRVSGTIASNIVNNGSESVGLMKSGSGSLTLSGQNSYTGRTNVQAGTLNVAAGASIEKSSQVAVANTGTLSVAGTTGGVTNNGTTTVSGTGRIAGTLNQQAGTVNLLGKASLGALATNGDPAADIHPTGSLKTLIANAQTSKATQDQKAAASLAGLSNVFKVGGQGQAATVNVGALTGYGTGYVYAGSTLSLGSNTSYGDALLGNGKVIAEGTNIQLHGANYWTGGLDVQAGTDVTAAGAQALGTGSLNLERTGSLTIDETGAETLSNSGLSGAGAFTTKGGGNLTLASSFDGSAFTGTTTVTGQSTDLTVDGKLGGRTDVAAGALISGSGTVNNLTLDRNAYLGVALAGKSGVASPLTLTGTENRLNGASVAMRVSKLSDMSIKQHYQTTILKLGDNARAAGSLDTGTVRAVNTAFVKGSVSEKGGDEWVLDYVRSADYSSYASSHNEYQLAGALNHADANGATAGFLTTLQNMEDGGAVRGAYNALSGEINASAKTAMVNDSFYLQEAVIDRLDCAGDLMRARAHDGKQQSSGYCDIDPRRPVSVWGTVYGQQGSQSGRSGVAGMGQSTVGWIMGADTRLKGGWRAGGMLAYGRDWFNVQSGRSSSAHSNSATIGAYVGNAWRVGGLTDNAAITFKGGVSYSWNMLHTNRRVMFPGYNGRLSSNNRSGTGQVFAESGYRMAFNQEGGIPLEVEPFARMTYVNYGQDSFHEHGADAALNVKGRDSSIGFSTFGVKLASSVSIGKMIFSPHAEFAYRRAFGRTNATIREGFSGLGGGYDMTVQGTPLSVDTAQINTGFAAHLTDRIDVNVDYIGQYGNRQSSTGGSGSMRLRF